MQRQRNNRPPKIHSTTPLDCGGDGTRLPPARARSRAGRTFPSTGPAAAVASMRGAHARAETSYVTIPKKAKENSARLFKQDFIRKRSPPSARQDQQNFRHELCRAPCVNRWCSPPFQLQSRHSPPLPPPPSNPGLSGAFCYGSPPVD